jgi:hypothetical protein
MCFYTDLWTGEKIGSSRDYFHADDIPVHGNVAIRAVCRKVTALEEAQGLPSELHYKYHEEVTLKHSHEEVVRRENEFRFNKIEFTQQ